MTSDLPPSDTRPLPLLTPQALCAQLSISYRTYSRLVRAGLPDDQLVRHLKMLAHHGRSR